MSAAASPGGPTERAKDVWDAQPAVGLRSVFRSGHLGLRIMKKQDSGGSIMSKSSVAELRYIGEPQVTHSAAKKGIIVVTKMMAVTYAKREVKLNTFVPGLINSPLVRLIAERDTAWDVTHAALSLASDEARRITGQEILAYGGLIDASPQPVMETGTKSKL